MSVYNETWDKVSEGVSLPYEGNVIYETTLSIVETGGFDS